MDKRLTLQYQYFLDLDFHTEKLCSLHMFPKQYGKFSFPYFFVGYFSLYNTRSSSICFGELRSMIRHFTYCKRREIIIVSKRMDNDKTNHLKKAVVFHDIHCAVQSLNVLNGDNVSSKFFQSQKYPNIPQRFRLNQLISVETINPHQNAAVCCRIQQLKKPRGTISPLVTRRKTTRK